MALRDQPYIPLYVDKFTADEKLRDCSPSANGVHIRLMCYMHKVKTDIYGVLPLNKKFAVGFAIPNSQANGQQLATPFAIQLAKQFAIQLAKQFPYDPKDVEGGLVELCENGVIYFDGYNLCQGGMIKQGQISDKRKKAGISGAKKRREKKNEAPVFAIANGSANSQPNGSANDVAKSINVITTIISKEEEGLSNNTGGGAGESETKGEEEINFYVGNWTLETPVKLCLQFFMEHQDFKNDRDKIFEKFKYQLLELPDDEILDRILGWGKIFNDRNEGNQPKRAMRGKDCWSQHFYHWVLKQDIKQNPSKIVDYQQHKNVNGRHNSNKKTGGIPKEGTDEWYIYYKLKKE